MRLSSRASFTWDAALTNEFKHGLEVEKRILTSPPPITSGAGKREYLATGKSKHLILSLALEHGATLFENPQDFYFVRIHKSIPFGDAAPPRPLRLTSPQARRVMVDSG